MYIHNDVISSCFKGSLRQRRDTKQQKFDFECKSCRLLICTLRPDDESTICMITSGYEYS